MARKLLDIDIEEISLVDRPANRKRFYIIKQEGTMWKDKELEKLFIDFFGEEEFENLKKSIEEEKKTEKKEKLTEEAINAIKGALNILNKYKDDFPKELKDAVKVLAEFVAKYPYPYPYPEKTKKSEGEGNLIDDLTDVEKAGRKLSKATIEQLKKAIEILQKLIEEREEEAGVKKQDKEGQKFEEILEKMSLFSEEVKKSIKSLEERIEEIEKKTAIKKSLDGQDDDKKRESKWPSFFGE